MASSANLSLQDVLKNPAKVTQLAVQQQQAAAPAAHEPDALAKTIAIATEQSAYRAADATGNTLVVTYTIANLRPPTIAPPTLPTSATVTDTLTALAGFDALADPNSIRGVLVSNVLTPGVTLLSSSVPMSQQGSSLVISAGDVPPLGNVTVTVKLLVPAASNDFVTLDNGANAFGTLQGRMVRAYAPSLTFAPDALGQFLAWTPDADTHDSEMLQQLGALGGSADAIYNYVRGLQYEVYIGSLRGTRGTLWGEAGNSVDKSSLLIAMLRARGIPSRYRHGALSVARAQELIGSMFPALPDQLGYVPSGLSTADPINSSALLSEAQDHWWVEAYLPGAGWTDLDPSFSQATAGQTFVASMAGDGTDRIAELPDGLRHKVQVRVAVERFNAFTTFNVGPSRIYPISQTLNAVSLVGNPLSLEHIVNTRNSGGLVFATSVHEYLPYLVIGDEAIGGQPFQDVISNFPLGWQVSTGEWIELVLRHPDGRTETIVREVADVIGADVRQRGGTIQPSFSPTRTLVDSGSQFVALLAPSAVPLAGLNRFYPELSKAGVNGLQIQQVINAETGSTPESVSKLKTANAQMRQLVRAGLRAQVIGFAASSDEVTHSLERGFHTRAYIDAPRVIIASQAIEDGGATSVVKLDLARNRVRFLPYPGQTVEGLVGFNTAWGLAQSALEDELMQRWHGKAPKSVNRIFDQARRDSVPLVRITQENIAVLGALPISDKAKTRIAQRLEEGPPYLIVVPARMIVIDGEPMIGWYEMDMLSGEVVDVNEDGFHVAAIEYAGILSSNLQAWPFAIIGFFHGFATTTFLFLGNILGQLPVTSAQLKSVAKASLDAAAARANEIADQISSVIGGAPIGVEKWIDCYVNGCGSSIGFKLTKTIFKSPIPDDLQGWMNWGLGVGGVDLPQPPGPCEVDYLGGSVSCKFEYTVNTPLGFRNGIKMAEKVIGGNFDPPVHRAYASRMNLPLASSEPVSRLVSFNATHAGASLNATVSTGNSYLRDGQPVALYAAATAGLGIAGNRSGFNTFAATASSPLAGADVLLGPANSLQGSPIQTGRTPLDLE